MVKKKRSLVSFGDREERKLPPVLALQVWDNDLFGPNDFLGMMDIDLTKVPKPFRHAKDCVPYDYSPDNVRFFAQYLRETTKEGVKWTDQGSLSLTLT